MGSQSPLSLPPSPLLHPLFPQIVVVWVGTNNHGHTAEQVTGGIKAIVQLVNERQPQARVVVLVRVGRAGGGTAVVWDPFGCSHSYTVLGSSAQGSGFQAKSHVEACCAHQKGCGEGYIWGQVAPFAQGTAGHFESENHSVVPDSLRPHGLYSPWNSPGQNTRVGSLSLLQGIFPTQKLNRGLLHYRSILYQLSCQGVEKLKTFK